MRINIYIFIYYISIGTFCKSFEEHFLAQHNTCPHFNSCGLLVVHKQKLILSLAWLWACFALLWFHERWFEMQGGSFCECVCPEGGYEGWECFPVCCAFKGGGGLAYGAQRC